MLNRKTLLVVGLGLLLVMFVALGWFIVVSNSTLRNQASAIVLRSPIAVLLPQSVRQSLVVSVERDQPFPEPASTRYVNTAFGFSFDYPEGFAIDAVTLKDNDKQLNLILSNERHEQISITVVIDHNKEHMYSYLGKSPDSGMVSPQEYEWAYFWLNGTTDENEVQSIRAQTWQNERLYSVEYTAPYSEILNFLVSFSF